MRKEIKYLLIGLGVANLVGIPICWLCYKKGYTKKLKMHRKPKYISYYR